VALGSKLGGALDSMLLRAMSLRFTARRPPVRKHHAPELQHDRRALLTQAIAFYETPEAAEQLVKLPPPARPTTARKSGLRGGEIVDLRWESSFEPLWPLLRDDYNGHAPNRFGWARLYKRSERAPTIICIHGYGGGPFAIEERAFPARWLHSLGLNVLLPVLPFHGKRAGAGSPVWPSVNVARTNEGFAHALWDLRALMQWVKRETGDDRVAVCGMSLGGYTTSLLATVEPLAFAGPMIPVASFPDLFWSHGEGSADRHRAEREGITLDMVQRSMAIHTPLLRKPMVPPERVLVMSAEGDRIAPPEHAARLAKHFGCEELREPGGHLLQLWRGAAFRAIARRLGALGLLAPR
jgi:pimeloyl-ACP methyl ester carboxylesterase